MKYLLVMDGNLNNLNDYISACRENPYKGAKLKELNESRVKACIYGQLGRLRIREPVYMRYRWYESSRRRDLDNISSFGRKVIQDALVKTCVLRNDGWKEIVGFQDEFYIDRDHPRIEVEIEVFGDGEQDRELLVKRQEGK